MFNKTTLRKFIAPKHQQYSSRNPKSEAPNPKQTERQINLKSGKSKTPNPTEAGLGFYLFCSFEIVSNFGFRASNFLLFAPLRLCASHSDWVAALPHFFAANPSWYSD